MPLPTLLRELRARKGLSGVAAAKAVGFSQAMLSKIERGQATVAHERLAALAALYGVPLVELQAEDAADRHRIELPEGIDRDAVKRAFYELTQTSRPAADPHAFACPSCGAGLVCAHRG